jgi:hypothetical protein
VLAATRRCTVNLNGPSTLSNNNAPVGGTVWAASRFLAPAVVNIYGPLCAQGNTAIRGGFASIQGSANVSVSDAAAVNIANNPGSDLDVRRLVFNVSSVPAVGVPPVNTARMQPLLCLLTAPTTSLAACVDVLPSLHRTTLQLPAAHVHRCSMRLHALAG